MDKRIAKRHKRQVSRAKAKVRLSEPDVRTPEQIKAAREASRPDAGRGLKSRLAGLFRNRKPAEKESESKTDS
jgi:hypothetical protein